MIRQAALPKTYLALAMAVAVHVRNRMHSGGAGAVPFTLATGKRADLSSMRVFGCPTYVHVDKSQRRRLDDRAWKGVFVGYASESPAVLVYTHATPTTTTNGESNPEQCNNDEEESIPRTMCSEENGYTFGRVDTTGVATTFRVDGR
jgi:hypothetical protein